MTKTTRKELLAVIKQRYLKATHSEKSEILDEFCKSTGYRRKYVIRILRAKHHYQSSSRKRPRTYSSAFMALVIKLWEILEYPCGTRLKPQLVPLAEALVRAKEIEVLE